MSVLCSKYDNIADYDKDLDLDAHVITETWLTGEDSDHRIIGDLTPDGYTFRHALCTHRKGGGVGILYRDSFKTQHNPKYEARSFENYQRVAIIYRLHLTKKNGLKSSVVVFSREIR